MRTSDLGTGGVKPAFTRGVAPIGVSAKSIALGSSASKVRGVNTVDPFERQRILNDAAELIRDVGNIEFRVDDVAKRCNVDVTVIHDYFDSHSQLIAEAQMANYFDLVEPQHRVMARVEEAIKSRDQESFWEAVEENMLMAWGSGQVDSKWGIVRMLQDIWTDPFSQRHFTDLLDIQFKRWIEVVEGAQRAGWIASDSDAKALIAFLWSASIGQFITTGSATLQLSPDDVRHFFRGVVRGNLGPEAAALR